MRSSPSLVLALVLAAAGLAWWALRGERTPSDDATAPYASRPAAAATDAELERSDAVPTAERAAIAGDSTPTDVETATADAEGLDAEEPQAAAGGGPWLEVRWADTGAPVPGAEVLYIAESQLGDVDAQMDLARGIAFSDWVERWSEHMTTDESGRTALPQGGGGCFVLARQDDAIGLFLTESGLDRDLVIEIAPMGSCEVEVVDHLENPLEGVGVTLGLVQRFPRFVLDVAETDGTGRVRLADWRPYLERLGMVREGPRVAASIEGVYAAPLEVELAERHFTGELLRVVRPACGAVEARLRRTDGLELAAGYDVLLFPFSSGHDLIGAQMRQVGPDGVVRFDVVELASDLSIRVVAQGMEVVHEQALTGPSREGEVVEIEIELESSGWRVAGRMLDARRQPAAGVRLAYDVGVRRAELEQLAAGVVESEEDGTFVLALPNDDLSGVTDLVVLFSTSDGLSAQLDVPVAGGQGTLEVGDLVLARAPLIAAGRVVDGEGSPISGVLVNASDLVRGWSFGGPERTAVSGADGTFELRGVVLGERVVLGAKRRHYRFEDAPEVALGSTDVHIVGSAGYGLVVRLLTDEGVPPELFELELGTTAERRHRWSTEFGPDGLAVLEGMAEGTMDVSVALENGPPLAEHLGVEPERYDGVTFDPPELEVDLRGAVRTATLRCVDAFGEPVAVERVRPADAEADSLAARIEPGSVRVYFGGESVDLTLDAPGFRSREETAVDGDREVRFVPQPRVRLVFLGYEPAPDGMVHVATMRSADQIGATVVPVGPSGAAEASVPYAGTHGVALLEQSRRTSDDEPRVLGEWTIEVVGSSELQEHALELP